MIGFVYGVVYQIVNCENDDKYVGSTTGPLDDRWGQHCRNLTTNSRAKKYKLYKYMNALGGDKFTIEVLEHGKFETKQALRIKEREWYDKLKPSLNTRRPFISFEERKADYIVKLNERITCHCGSITSRHNLLRHEKSKKHIEFEQLS